MTASTDIRNERIDSIVDSLKDKLAGAIESFDGVQRDFVSKVALEPQSRGDKTTYTYEDAFRAVAQNADTLAKAKGAAWLAEAILNHASGNDEDAPSEESNVVESARLFTRGKWHLRGSRGFGRSSDPIIEGLDAYEQEGIQALRQEIQYYIDAYDERVQDLVALDAQKTAAQFDADLCDSVSTALLVIITDPVMRGKLDRKALEQAHAAVKVPLTWVENAVNDDLLAEKAEADVARAQRQREQAAAAKKRSERNATRCEASIDGGGWRSKQCSRQASGTKADRNGNERRCCTQHLNQEYGLSFVEKAEK